MWTRSELKQKAKVAFKSNFWNCVLVAFVLGLLVNGSSCAGSSTGSSISNNSSFDSLFEDDYYDDILNETYYYDDSYYYGDGFSYNESAEEPISSAVFGVGFIALSIVLVVAIIVIVIAVVLQIFVFAPIEVGGCRFFVDNSTEQASASLLFYAFGTGHYKNIVLTLFLRDLYTFLWSLLFIIPGIVKSYEYRMVPYLLADCPDMPKEDAFSISKELMRGNKWAAFVLDLSFIGWNILNMFTCGLLGIFWTSPYVQATNAELFLALKGNYFSGQYVTQGSGYGEEF